MKVCILNKLKFGIKLKRFYSQPICDDKYIKTKVKIFSSMINTLFSDNEIPKERNHYICVAAICIVSVLKVDKKNYPQVYLGQCKYKIKRRKPVKFLSSSMYCNSFMILMPLFFHLVLNNSLEEQV